MEPTDGHGRAGGEPSPDAERARRLARLGGEAFDLLVVGGGITGAGVARDAALRGLRTALVERRDFAVGTSSRSSKLVHGGIRYLENLEVGLVLESVRERAVQRRLNPHLVWPVPFVYPIYAGDRHGLAKIDAGLWVYDALCLFRGQGRHRRLAPPAVAARVPGLRREGLRGALTYLDCRTDDARLTLANALDAERHGAAVASYARYVAPVFEGERVAGARVHDELLGREVTVRCHHVAYCGGAWTDGLPSAPGDGRLLRRTKGVHLVVDRSRLPVDDVVVMTAVADGRMVFAVPFDGCTYVGTTDTDYDGDLDRVRATGEDLDYLLATVNRYFPDARLGAADVRSTWAGLRPLIRDDADSAYRTSREHEVFPDPRGLTTVAGGKLSTYRAMAEEVVDAVVKDLARAKGVKAAPCRTARVPLDPALPEVPDPATGPEDPLERALWRTHGSAMAWVRARMAASPAEAARVTEDLPLVMAQVSRAVLHEQAWHLEDVLVRRLPIFYQAADQGLARAPAVARHMAALLGRDAAWVEAQVAAYGALVEQSRLGARALASLGGEAAAAGQPSPLGA